MEVGMILALLKRVPSKLYIAFALVTALVAGAIYVRHLQNEIQRVELRSMNDKARATATIRVLSSSIEDIYQKYSIQTDKIKKDEVNKKFGTETKVDGTFVATIGSVTDTVKVAQYDSVFNDWTKERFHSYKEPFTLDLEVIYNEPFPSMLVWTAKADPIKVNFRVECGEPINGVRPASVLVGSPKWASIVVDSVRQNKDVCNAEAPRIDIRTGPSAKAIAGVGIVGALVGAGAYWFTHK
jgi:hypothetical protein